MDSNELFSASTLIIRTNQILFSESHGPLDPIDTERLSRLSNLWALVGDDSVDTLDNIPKLCEKYPSSEKLEQVMSLRKHYRIALKGIENIEDGSYKDFHKTVQQALETNSFDQLPEEIRQRFWAILSAFAQRLMVLSYESHNRELEGDD